MEDRRVLSADRLKTLLSLNSDTEDTNFGIERLDGSLMEQESFRHRSSLPRSDCSSLSAKGDEGLELVECRICQEEDFRANMEVPCACSGSLKYAHRKCIQRWCNEKRDTICEICLEQYKPDFTAYPSRQDDDENSPFDIRTTWEISEAQPHLSDPRFYAMITSDRRFMESEYDEYASENTTSSSCCRTVVLIFVSVILMRHILTIISFEYGDPLTVFVYLIIKAAGFLLPCYIMALIMSAIQQRRQRQEAAMTAMERNDHIPESRLVVSNNEHRINMP